MASATPSTLYRPMYCVRSLLAPDQGLPLGATGHPIRVFSRGSDLLDERAAARDPLCQQDGGV